MIFVIDRASILDRAIHVSKHTCLENWFKCSRSPLVADLSFASTSAVAGCDKVYSVDDDVIKWKHFPRNWPFVRRNHRSPVDPPHKGQLRRALMFHLIWAWTNGLVNNPDPCDLRRHRAHYDVIIMDSCWCLNISSYILPSEFCWVRRRRET